METNTQETSSAVRSPIPDTKAPRETPPLGNLAAALALAQGEIAAAPKDRDVKVTMKAGGTYTFSYSTLSSVWEVIRGPLSRNGLAVVQPVVIREGSVTVTTLLVHASGERIHCDVTMPVAEKTPQGYGSAITYARRYGLSTMVGVASDEDDDGAEAAGHTSTPQPRHQAPQQSRVAAVAQKVAAKASPPTPGPAPERVVEFGPLKGKPLAGLEAAELSDTIALFEEKLREHPKAQAAPALSANLVELKEEQAKRMEGVS